MFVITGGGSGIGKALTLELAKRDKSVLIIGRREQLLQDTASSSSRIQYLCADVGTLKGREEIKEFMSGRGPIDALVNNAGTLNPQVGVKDIKFEDWQSAFHTNLDAPLFLPQILFDQLTYGRVLNIGSGAAYFAIKGWTTYCTTKAALSMLTRCWQLEIDYATVAFASVMPGIIDTDMQAIARQGQCMDSEQTDFYRRLKQQGRLLSPETVAQFLCWLLLDINKEIYSSKEWDIYDKTHHQSWLKEPYKVPHWE